MPKINVNSRDNFSSIYGIVDKYADTISQPVNADSDVIFNSLLLTEDLIVNGNVQFNGETTIVSTDVIEFKDNIIEINSGEQGSGVSANHSGIRVDRGTLPSYDFVFEESSDSFKIGQINDLQTVATREDNPLNNGIMVFDTNSRLLFSTNEIQNDIKFIGSPTVSTSTGSITSNGVGITGDIFLNGFINFGNSSNTIHTKTSGNLEIASGKDLYFALTPGHEIFIPEGITLSFNENSTISTSVVQEGLYITSTENVVLTSPKFRITPGTSVEFANNNNVDYSTLNYNGSLINFFSQVNIGNFTNSFSGETGALVVQGGVGINGSNDAVSPNIGGALTVSGGVGINKKLFVGGDVDFTSRLKVHKKAELAETVVIGSIDENLSNFNGSFSKTLGFKVDDFLFTDDETPSLGLNTNVNTVSLGRTRLSAINSGIAVTNANTLFIKGPPVVNSPNVIVTNFYSLHVATGNTLLGGNSTITGFLDVNEKITGNKGVETVKLDIINTNTTNTNADNQGKFLNIIPSNLNDAITIGTAGEMFFNRIGSGILSSTSSVTTTTTATLVIDNEPIQGTNQIIINSYAFLIKSGKAKMNDVIANNVILNDLNINGDLQVNGNSNITNISTNILTVKNFTVEEKFNAEGNFDLTLDPEAVVADYEESGGSGLVHLRYSEFKVPTLINPNNFPVDKISTVYIEGPVDATSAIGESYSLYVSDGLSRFEDLKTETLVVNNTSQLNNGAFIDTNNTGFTVQGTKLISFINTDSYIEIYPRDIVLDADRDIDFYARTNRFDSKVGGNRFFTEGDNVLESNKNFIVEADEKVIIDGSLGLEIGKQSDGAYIQIGDLTSETTIGNNLVVLGNFAVKGENVELNSTSIKTDNNSIIINSMPFGVSDAGVLVRRFQIPNDNGQGQVVNDDNPRFNSLLADSIGNDIWITNGQNFIGWWLKVTSGPGTGQVRRIKSHDTINNTISLYETSDNDESFSDGMDLTTTLTEGTTIQLYPGTYSGFFFDDTDNTWVTGKIPLSENAGKFPFPDLADFKARNTVVTSMATQSLTVSGSSNISGNVSSGKQITIKDEESPLLRFERTAVGNFDFEIGMAGNSDLFFRGGADGSGNDLSNRFVIQGDGSVKIPTNLSSTSITQGSLVVSGGTGISGNLSLGGLLLSNDAIAGGLLSGSILRLRGSSNPALPGKVLIETNSTSTSPSSGALVVAGGTGIAGTLYTGGIVRFQNTSNSTSTTTGALVVSGGTGIVGDLNVGGTTRILDTTTSTSSTTGALVVSGGTGIVGDLNVGGTTRILDTTTSTSSTTGALVVSGGLGVAFGIHCSRLYTSIPNIGVGTTSNSHSLTIDSINASIGLNQDDSLLIISGSNSVNNGSSFTLYGNQHSTIPGSLDLTAGNVVDTGKINFITAGINRMEILYNGIVRINTTTESNSNTTGALVVSGGIGLEKDLRVGKDLYVESNSNLGTVSTGLWNASVIAVEYGGTGNTAFTQDEVLLGNGTGALSSATGLSYSTGTGILSLPRLVSTNTDASTSSTSGPISFIGGVSIAKNLYVGTNLYTTGNIGIGTDVDINSELTLIKNSNIGINTIGGSDDGFLTISGGGSGIVSRGGVITLYGNEHSVSPGEIHFDALNKLILKTAGNERISIDSTGIIISTNTTSSTDSSTGAVVLEGGISISNTTNSSSLTNGGSFTTAGGMAVAKDIYIGGDMTVTGDIFSNSIVVLPYTDVQANIILISNLSSAVMVSGKYKKIFGEKEIRGVFIVQPSVQYATCEFTFRAIESAFDSPYDAIPSTQGFTQNKSIENLVCLSIENTGTLSITFTSNSTEEHVIQFVIKYS